MKVLTGQRFIVLAGISEARIEFRNEVKVHSNNQEIGVW